MGRSSTAAKPRKRDADTKLAQGRLSVPELAKELGNVAEPCRQRGLDLTSFYEWKRRFQTQGFDGLKDLPPFHKSHPQTTPEPVVQRIKDLALAHPAYGCIRHEAMLALEG
jgi:transposase